MIRKRFSEEFKIKAVRQNAVFLKDGLSVIGERRAVRIPADDLES